MSQDDPANRPPQAAESARPLRESRPRLGRQRWILLGVATGLFIGFMLALSLTQTRWGREQILDYTLRSIGGRLNGVLAVDDVRGNLITGARLYGVSLTDMDGEPLAVLDSAHIQYRVASFVGGDMVINRLVVWNANISIFRMPGDTIWNYQEILQDPTPDPLSPASTSATLIESLRLISSQVSVRAPLAVDSRLSPERQQLALEEILADTARWMIQEVPGGHLRQMLFDVDQADVSELFIGPDERGGIYLEVENASADARLWRDPPLEIDSLVAELHLQEGIVNVRAPRFVLPDSEGELVGRIDIRGERPMYDIVITSPRVTLADLRWLYPWLPADPRAGQGSGRVYIEDRPDDLLFVTRDLVLEMPGTRVTGNFGMITGGETLQFVDVDLEADPLDIDSVERLLPEELPVEGLAIGGAIIEGQGATN